MTPWQHIRASTQSQCKGTSRLGISHHWWSLIGRVTTVFRRYWNIHLALSSTNPAEVSMVLQYDIQMASGLNDMAVRAKMILQQDSTEWNMPVLIIICISRWSSSGSSDVNRQSQVWWESTIRRVIVCPVRRLNESKYQNRRHMRSHRIPCGCELYSPFIIRSLHTNVCSRGAERSHRLSLLPAAIIALDHLVEFRKISWLRFKCLWHLISDHAPKIQGSASVRAI